MLLIAILSTAQAAPCTWLGSPRETVLCIAEQAADALALASEAAALLAAATTCPDGWADAGGYCYSPIQPEAMGYDASAACALQGAEVCSASQMCTIGLVGCDPYSACWTRHMCEHAEQGTIYAWDDYYRDRPCWTGCSDADEPREVRTYRCCRDLLIVID